jgi:hypothetical protein
MPYLNQLAHLILRRDHWIRASLVGLAFFVVLSLQSCNRAGSEGASASSDSTFTMGSRVQVGSMVYTVLDTDWVPELTGKQGTQRPQHRFLIVRITMTNSGGEKLSLPYFTLISPKGEQYSEVSENIEDTPDWLGVLRELAPAQTDTGTVVFDAPLGAYKLQVSDGGPIDRERTVRIDLPLDFKVPVTGGNN